MSCVYFVELMGYVKIGYSREKTPDYRVNSMKTCTPIEPFIAGFFSFEKDNGTRGRLFEKILHVAFSYCHFRAEWFEASPVLEWLYRTFAYGGEAEEFPEFFSQLEAHIMVVSIKNNGEYAKYLPQIEKNMAGN